MIQAGICQSSLFSSILFLLDTNDDTFHYHWVVPEYLSFTMNGFSLQEAVYLEHLLVQTHPRSLDASEMVGSQYHSSKYFVTHAALSVPSTAVKMVFWHTFCWQQLIYQMTMNNWLEQEHPWNSISSSLTWWQHWGWNNFSAKEHQQENALPLHVGVVIRLRGGCNRESGFLETVWQQMNIDYF